MADEDPALLYVSLSLIAGDEGDANNSSYVW